MNPQCITCGLLKSTVNITGKKCIYNSNHTFPTTNKKKKILIMSDTHFNHKRLIEWGRPNDFEELILKNLMKIDPIDIFIHLGDVCIGNDEIQHSLLTSVIPASAKKILVKGNHDNKSNNWYLDHGWDFVCDGFTDTYYGKKIIFSHRPQFDNGTFDINIHGHLHGNSHRDSDADSVYYDTLFHFDVSPDIHEYQPLLLEDIINKMIKETPLIPKE